MTVTGGATGEFCMQPFRGQLLTEDHQGTTGHIRCSFLTSTQRVAIFTKIIKVTIYFLYFTRPCIDDLLQNDIKIEDAMKKSTFI